MQDNSQTANNQTNPVAPDMAKPFGVTPTMAPDPSAPTEPVTTAPTTDPSQIFAPVSLNPDDNTSSSTPSVASDTGEKTQKPVGKLETIKEKALKDLTPLLDNLDQTPEEKYKTLMMVIQASDNQDLVSDAYDAAQKITDPKTRADALVGIINEINYFTQPK